MNQKHSEPALVAAGLLESGFALLRAEVALALMRARQLTVRAVGAGLAMIVACAFAQLTVVLVVLLPILSAVVPIENAVVSIASSAFVALAFGVGAAFAWVGALRSRDGKIDDKIVVDARQTSPSGGASGYDTQGPSGPVTFSDTVNQ